MSLAFWPEQQRFAVRRLWPEKRDWQRRLLASYDPIFVAIIELDERQITMALLAATFKLEADRDFKCEEHVPSRRMRNCERDSKIETV